MVVEYNGGRVTRVMDITAWHAVRRRLRGLTVLALLCVLTACSSAPRRPPAGTLEPDKFLWERGSEALESRRWFTAREYFRQLVDSYPQSPFRADAKLGVGDSFLGEGTLESQLMAINEYREFLSFYPTHPRADYAQYQLGMAHFKQMRNAYRDQTETKEAIAEFSVFLQRFPSSPLLPDARQRLREAKDRLGQSEYNVGLQYYRMKWYPGAIDRFLTLLKTDPEYTYRDSVYYYLAQALVQIDRPFEALPFFDRLIEEFESSEPLEAAQRQAAQLKAQLGKKQGDGGDVR
jgi:outer membrane protein assembly factor BamD